MSIIRYLLVSGRLWASRQHKVTGAGIHVLRALLLAWAIVVLYRILTLQSAFTPFDWVTFIVHEAGHVLFAPFGMFMGIAGGSILQLAVPLLVALVFFLQSDLFSASFCFCWLGESLLNLSFYIEDAPLQKMPLTNIFGGEPVHDWFYLLGSTGLINGADELTLLTRFTAFLAVLFFLVYGGWLFLLSTRFRYANETDRFKRFLGRK